VGLFEKAFWLWVGCNALNNATRPKAVKPKPEMGLLGHIISGVIAFFLAIWVMSALGC
jgi:hypothetical protein